MIGIISVHYESTYVGILEGTTATSGSTELAMLYAVI
jgi:hypothetical protein